MADEVGLPAAPECGDGAGEAVEPPGEQGHAALVRGDLQPRAVERSIGKLGEAELDIVAGQEAAGGGEQVVTGAPDLGVADRHQERQLPSEQLAPGYVDVAEVEDGRDVEEVLEPAVQSVSARFPERRVVQRDVAAGPPQHDLRRCGQDRPVLGCRFGQG